MINTFKKIAWVGILMCLPVAGANAATLAPGGSTFVTGTTVAAEPVLAGSVINDNILDAPPVLVVPGPFSTVILDLQNRVTRSTLDNTLIFGPRIFPTGNNTLGNFLVDSIVLSGFGDFATDVAYRTDGLGDRGPTFGGRSADGDTLTFDFGFPLVIGNLAGGILEESYFFSINTDATLFENTGRATIFGRSTVAPGEVFRFDYAGLAVPVSASVPVPASSLLLLSGLGLIFGARRKQKG